MGSVSEGTSSVNLSDQVKGDDDVKLFMEHPSVIVGNYAKVPELISLARSPIVLFRLTSRWELRQFNHRYQIIARKGLLLA